MPFSPSTTDDPVAQLTDEGRNLLARSITLRGTLLGTEPPAALVTFKLSGFVMGDGGYLLSNPLQVSPTVDATTQATATITLINNSFDVGDSIEINGVSFPVGLASVFSGTASSGTDNGGLTLGYDDGTINNLSGGGGTLIVTGSFVGVNAHVGQRLRITGGTGVGLDEQIVANTTTFLEIGIVNSTGTPSPPAPPLGATVGKSFAQTGFAVPDGTSTFEIFTTSPGGGTWVPGSTLEESAQNLAALINASTDPLIHNVVAASVVGAVITINSVALGTIGNLNTLGETNGAAATANFTLVPGTGFLAGGVSPSLESPRFPTNFLTAVEAFTTIEAPSTESVSLVCRVPTTDGNFGLGEIGIYVDIQDSAIASEIGQRVLYAIGHFPLLAKNSKNVLVMRVITQF